MRGRAAGLAVAMGVGAAGMLVPPPAGGFGTVAHGGAALPGTLRAVGHVGNRDVVLDTLTGRVTLRPTAATASSSGTAGDSADGGSSAPSDGGGAPPAWDANLAGDQETAYGAAVHSATGPGAIASILGGLCDGLPGPQVSVDPGNIAVDRAGRVFWVDEQWASNHLRGLPAVRVLDTDGRVRTLGSVAGPAEGRAVRDGGAFELLRIVPDQQGGVFYSFPLSGTAYAAFADPGNQVDDLPAQAVVGHLDGGGAATFVAGQPGRNASSQYYNNPDARNDGAPAAQAVFGSVEALAADAAGDLYVVDGDGGAIAVGRGGTPREAATDTATGGPGTQYEDDQALLRFVNRSGHDVTFFAGTAQQVTVAAGTVGTIVGPPAGTPQDGTHRYQGLAAPAPGKPQAVRSADLGFVDGLAVAPDGHVEILENDPTDQSVALLAVDTGSAPQTVHGATLQPGVVTALSRGPAGDAGDGGAVSGARFDVAGDDSWFYGDIAVDGQGDTYVADTLNHRVRRVDAAGGVSTVIGTTAPGDGGDGLAGGATALRHPMGVAVAPSGDLLVSDWGNSRIRALHGGVTHTVGGNGVPGDCGAGVAWAGDATLRGRRTAAGPLRNAAFTAGADAGSPHDAVADGAGNVYVADPDVGVVRRITADGSVSIVAGVPRRCPAGPPDQPGLGVACNVPTAASGDGGPATAARLQQPQWLVVDRYGNLYVSDLGNVRYVNLSSHHLVVHNVPVDPGKIITVLSESTVATPGLACSAPDCSATAGFGPMALDGDSGTLYVSDLAGHRVLALDWCGNQAVVAGNGQVPRAGAPDGDRGPALSASIDPRGLALDTARDLLLVADVGSDTVRAVNLGSASQSIWGRALAPGAIDSYAGGAPCTTAPAATQAVACSYGDGSAARSAAFAYPFSVAIAAGGRVLVAELDNRVRSIAPDGTVGTVAGITADSREQVDGEDMVGGECGDGGLATSACLGGSVAVSVTPQGALLVTDFGTARVRRVGDIAHAPVRRPDAPLSGAGWRFTPPVHLAGAQGGGLLDPLISVDAHGQATIAAALYSGAQPVGCELWTYAAAGGTTVSLGSPDSSTAVAAVTNRGACSVARARTSAAGTPPLLAYADGTRFSEAGSASPIDAQAYAGAVAQRAANVVAGVSADGGAHFAATPASLATPHLHDAVDPWLAALPSGGMAMSYVAYDAGDTTDFYPVVGFATSVAGTPYLHRSDVFAYDLAVDAPPSNVAGAAGPFAAEPVVAPDGSIDVPLRIVHCMQPAATCRGLEQDSTDEQLRVAHSADGGATWTLSAPLFSYPCTRAVPSAVSGGDIVPRAYCLGDHGLPQLTAGRDGTVWATWDDGHHVLVAHSPDGLHWSAPVRVDRGLRAAVYPTLVAGDAGRVAVAFYGTTSAVRGAGSRAAQWWLYLAASVDAAAPGGGRFAQSLAGTALSHTGELCVAPCAAPGRQPVTGNAGPGGAGSYFRAALDPLDGRVLIAATESPGLGAAGLAGDIVVTRQCDGPSLLVAAAAVPCGDAAESTAPSVGSAATGRAVVTAAPPPANRGNDAALPVRVPLPQPATTPAASLSLPVADPAPGPAPVTMPVPPPVVSPSPAPMPAASTAPSPRTAVAIAAPPSPASPPAPRTTAASPSPSAPQERSAAAGVPLPASLLPCSARPPTFPDQPPPAPAQQPADAPAPSRPPAMPPFPSARTPAGGPPAPHLSVPAPAPPGAAAGTATTPLQPPQAQQVPQAATAPEPERQPQLALAHAAEQAEEEAAMVGHPDAEMPGAAVLALAAAALTGAAALALRRRELAPACQDRHRES